METKEMLVMLRAPFSDDELEKKVQSTNSEKTKGMVAFYVSARAIQNRLDDVFGFDGWKTSYKEVNGGYICSLSVRVNGEWITKEDGAPATQFESIKGGISNAFKRVASSGFGIGRYLYDSVPEWHPIKQKGKGFVFENPDSIKLKLKKKNNTPVSKDQAGYKPSKILKLDEEKEIIGKTKAKEITDFFFKKIGGELKIKSILDFYSINSMEHLKIKDFIELKKYKFNLEEVAKEKKVM